MSKHRIRATATGLPKLTRRNFATAAAATPLVALPVGASKDIEGLSDYKRGHDDALNKVLDELKSLDAKKQQSPIQRLFKERQEKLDVIRTGDLDLETPLGDRLFNEIISIEGKILEQKATSRVDLAAKVLLDTNEGDFGISPSFLEECREILHGAQPKRPSHNKG